MHTRFASTNQTTPAKDTVSLSTPLNPQTPQRIVLPLSRCREMVVQGMADLQKLDTKDTKEARTAAIFKALMDTVSNSLHAQCPTLSFGFKADLRHEIYGVSLTCQTTLAKDIANESYFQKNGHLKPGRNGHPPTPLIPLEQYDAVILKGLGEMLGSIQRAQTYFDNGLAASDPMSPAKVWEIALNTATEAARAKGIALDVQHPALLDTLQTRIQYAPHKLYGLWSNVLLNAVKYTPEGGYITVDFALSSQACHPALLFSVTDNGIGILPEDQGQVTCGVRGKNAQDLGIDGTGYGLQRVKKLLLDLEIQSPLNPDNAQRPGTRMNCWMLLDESPECL